MLNWFPNLIQFLIEPFTNGQQFVLTSLSNPIASFETQRQAKVHQFQQIAIAGGNFGKVFEY